jgi:phage tail sheath protein FI
MAARTISSPGVQINEVDLSAIARPTGETNVFITGFTAQGPTDEVVNITSLSDYESIFGLPTNAAERYLYHSAKQILTTSPANLLVTRIPYGTSLGEGFSNKYSALVFPICANNAVDYSLATEYQILEPVSILLDDDQYEKLVTNDVAWLSSYNSGTINDFGKIGYGGIVVLNDAKTTINNVFEGYYVGFADNDNNNPSTNFESITGMRAYASGNGTTQNFVSIPTNRLNFALSGVAGSLSNDSISEVIENYPNGYDFSANVFNDYLTTMLFKIRPSIYKQDTVSLDYIVSEAYSGSLYSLRQLNNPNGGSPKTSFLDNVVNTSSNNIRIITNPYISTTGSWVNGSGIPSKKVRVSNSAKNLYGVGVYISDTDKNSKDVGDIPLKLERVLRCLENDDIIRLDVVAEAGLGTVWSSAKVRKADPNFSTEPTIFDDLYNVDLTNGTVNTGLYDTTGNNNTCTARDEYLRVISQFHLFADKTRKDHVFISDPLRNIFVQGSNTKLAKNKSFNFSQQIYWALRNLYGGLESSYMTTYGNWIKTGDSASDSLCWIPASGYVAAIFAESAQTSYPWSAPAGFNRGKLNNVIDIAINPTQKQRDLLYKININPIAFFPNDGNVIFGQKTLYRKPSAFDRINVRRLFLTLEKTTQEVLKLFVFEPNSFTTRSRILGALTPIFDEARLHDGLYDYTIVCDERNNPPATIDNNELRVSIYIQPVRTAEFILADFIATRTGVNFEELIS